MGLGYILLGVLIIGTITLVLCICNASAVNEIHNALFREAMINFEVKKRLAEQTYETAKSYLILEHSYSEEQAIEKIDYVIKHDNDVGLKFLYTDLKTT